MTTQLQISNCSKQDTQNLEEYIRHLYTYIKNKLNFSIEPIVKLIDDKQNSKNPLGSTAHYEPSTKTISVFITDRHIKDILRSIAHELIHHEQNCNNMISADSDMSEGYAQKNKQLRNLEEDAFSRGNLLFRDWEHSLKRKKRKSKKVQENKRLDMKKPVYESLEGYKEKNNKFLTEAVFEKFGFSLKNLLNEAKPRAPKGPAIPKPPTATPPVAATTQKFTPQPESDYPHSKTGIKAKSNIAANLNSVGRKVYEAGVPGNIELWESTIKEQYENLMVVLQPSVIALYSSVINNVPTTSRSGQYAGARAQVGFIDPITSTIENSAKEETEVFAKNIVNATFQAACQVTMHFLQKLDAFETPTLQSTIGRPNKENAIKRRQPWGEKSLRLWNEYIKNIVRTTLKSAWTILDKFPGAKNSLTVTVGPEIASMIWRTENQTKVLAARAIVQLSKTLDEVGEETSEDKAKVTSSPQTPGEAPASEPPPPPPPESAPVADKPESVAATASKPPRRIVNKMETPDQANPRAKSPGKPGKKKKKEEGEDPDRLPDKEDMPKVKFSGLDESKISLSTPNDVRKNTINVITLLEKLTNKGK